MNRIHRVIISLVIILFAGLAYSLVNSSPAGAIPEPFTNPHGLYISGTPVCAKCHSGHDSGSKEIVRLVTQRETCYACHDGSNASPDIRHQFGENTIGSSVYAGSGSFHPVPTVRQLCTNCHDPHLATEATPGGTASLLAVGPAKIPSGNAVCGYCHGPGSTAPGGDMVTSFTGTPHDTTMTNPSSGTQIKCARCHQPHGSPYDALVRTIVTDQSGVRNEVYGDDKTFCFGCHINQLGVYEGKTIYNLVYHGTKAISSVANIVYPGTGYSSDKATACQNCHEPHKKPGFSDYKRAPGNELCYGCHTDALVPASYSYRGTSAYFTTPHVSATVYGQAIPAGNCLLCHAVHGKNNGSGSPYTKQLRLANENVCFGGASGACHDSSSNSARGINIKSRLTVGSNRSARHSITAAEQSAGGTKVDCINCHDPHLNNAASKVVDPANRYTVYTLTKGFNDYISDTGAVYLMVKARHDGIAPTVNSGPTVSNMAATTCQIDWTTNEWSNCIVEYGATSAYGSIASATVLNAGYTQHRVILAGLVLGQNYHYRVKATDRVGNYSYTADAVLDSVAPTITVAPSISGATGTTATISWTTDENSTSYVDFNTQVDYAVYGYIYHPGDNNLVTSHSVTLTGLTAGVDYQYQAHSMDARGNSVTSSHLTFRLTTPPSAPVIIPEADFGGGPDVSVTLECYEVSDPNPPIQYRFVVSTASDFSTTYWDSNWVNKEAGKNPYTTFTVSNYYAVTYYWHVKARNSYNIESSWSDTGAGTDYHFVHDGGYPPKIDSCPFIYTWNGTVFEYVSDMSGPVINLPRHIKVDANKRIPYYLPTNNMVPDKNNQYLVKIRSTAPGEIDILDQIGLVLVDHPPGYEIASSNAESSGQFMKYDPARKLYAISKQALTVKNAVDKYGKDVTKELLKQDNIPAPSETRNFAESSSYILDFGKLEHPEYARLILDGWTYYKKEIKTKPKDVPRVEVINSKGKWETVRNIGFISGDKKTMVVDLAGSFKTEDHRVRIFVGEKDRRFVLDRVRLDQSPPVKLKTTYVSASYADLYFRGPANQVGATFDHPVLAKDDVKAGAINYIFYGKFTKYGNVRELLAKTDDMFVIMQHGDEILLKFVNPPLQAGLERTPVMMADFYYKQTGQPVFNPKLKIPVEPLPFHKMSRYPYLLPEKYPNDQAHQQYQNEWLTREYTLVDGNVVPAESVKTSLWSRFTGFFGDLWNQLAGLLRTLFKTVEITVSDNAGFTKETGGIKPPGLAGKQAGTQTQTQVQILPQLAYGQQTSKPQHYSLNANYVLLQADIGTSITQYNVNSSGAEIFESSTAPSPSSPGTDASAQKSKVLTDDGNRWTTDSFAPNTNDGGYNYQTYKYAISEPKSKLTAIRLFWKGYGEPTAGYNTTVSLWNFTTSGWNVIYDTVIGSETSLNIQKYEDFQPYCYKCHAGTVPPGVQLGSITRNISSSYPTDAHGGGTSYDDAGTTINAPYVRGNGALPCNDCHDLHGSQNAYHLRENVNTNTGLSLPDMSVVNQYDTSKNAAILTYCQSCHAGTLDSFHMAKCLSCHRDPTGHDCYPPAAGDFSRACTYCHTHGGYMPIHGSCHCTLNNNTKAF